uniref:Carboxypeptidase N subunit 2-like n=1 Tax=Seriola dumerili TaxID=41447 RepID=A0A3B4UA73_SERDU
MNKELGLTLSLVLLFCHKGNTESHTSCPYKCQCFTSVQVLCADERMISLPRNMSKQVKDFIIMTSAVAYLLPHTLEESPQLTKIVFLNNALRSIHAQAFDHLTELHELEISGNPWLEHLFLGTFSKQRNLTKLLLNFNRFKAILPGMFDSLKQLETLQMKGNIISDLPTFLFLNLHNLRVLDLSQNKLEGVKRETFSGLARLEILKINNNLISNLTSDTFHNISHDLTSLSDIILSSNQLSKLPEDIFRNITLLENLDLSENQLTFLPERIFNQTFIQQLYLSDNQLHGNPWRCDCHMWYLHDWVLRNSLDVEISLWFSSFCSCLH